MILEQTKTDEKEKNEWLNDNTESEEKRKKSKGKGAIYGFNLLFLIVNIPLSIYCGFMFVFFLIIGIGSIHTLLRFLALLGEAIIISGFVMSSKRVKAKNVLIIQEYKEIYEKNILRKLLEIILGILGLALTVSVFAILMTLEYDFW